MAKIRLTEGLRLALKNLFREVVSCPAEMKALERAYAKASPLIAKIVAVSNPPAEMEVLKKYECARPDACIRLQLTAGGVNEFTFMPDDAPLTPTRYCGGRMYPADERATAAFNAWADASLAYKAAVARKQTDYFALITGSRYLEEIETVWPEASRLRKSALNNLPATLTDDAIARIRADVQQRAKAA